MTHHKCVPRTIGGKSFMMCVTCGMAFPDTVTAGEVMASECVKVKRYDILDTRYTLPSSKADPLIERLPIHDLIRVDVEGARLLDAWRKERGEL